MKESTSDLPRMTWTIADPLVGDGSIIKALDGEDRQRKRSKRKPEFDPRGRGRERSRKIKNEFGTVAEFSVYWWFCV